MNTQETKTESVGIQVPRAVLDGIEAVRKSGLTNLLARNAVQKIANDLGYFETVIWIEDNQKLYAEGMFRGFTAEEGN